jgi:hypothetical protein
VIGPSALAIVDKVATAVNVATMALKPLHPRLSFIVFILFFSFLLAPVRSDRLTSYDFKRHLALPPGGVMG